MRSQTLTDQRTSRGPGILNVLQFAGPIVLAIVAGYGTVKYAEGTTNQRIATLESDSKTLSEDQQRVADRAITREEFNQFRETLRDDIKEIKTDVRAIRSDLNRGTY